jgi:O-antigen ligase
MNLDRVQVALLAGIAATCLVSIFAAEAVFLSLALVVFVARAVTGRARLGRTPLDGPILAFAVWTLLSAAFSPDPLTSHDSAKKLILFAIFYLAVDVGAHERDRERMLTALLLGGLVLSAGAILQFYFLGFDSLGKRPRSFMGHYMTASGLAMGVFVVSGAWLACNRRWAAPSREDLRLVAGVLGGVVVLAFVQSTGLFVVEAERLFVAGLAALAVVMALSRAAWPGGATTVMLAALAFPVSAWALVLTRTRNAWLGAVTGLVVVAVLRAPRVLWAVAGLLLAFLVVRPSLVGERLTLADASSVDRYYMWQAGIDMIREKPVFGQGPGMILAVYPEYRWAGAPNPRQPHLHDNALQIAAERGLPCLAFWIWMVAAAMADAYREWRLGRRTPSAWVAAASLALLAAVMVAGLFEYNFGDSEVLMLTLLVAALPYAVRRQRELRPA